ncbi:MAG: alpha/beta hydrolase [Kouleothrix sp.]|nr:alpha/beta hydrolase [Kouleothrix sp.]
MHTANLAHYRAAEKRLCARYGLAPTEHFVRLPKLKTTVRVVEVGQGQPVLFVHGSPNAALKWAPLAAQLPDFRCLLLDRPGCGLSEPVDYRSLDLRTFGVDLLGQTLDGLDLPQAAIVASSLGGALAFYFTHAHPERVVRLVQDGCPAFVEGFRVPLYNILGSALSLLTGRTPPSRAAFRHLGHAAGIDQGRFDLEVLRWRDALLKYTETTRHENGLTRNMSRRMREYGYGAAFLRQIAPPTLYLWGEADPFGGVAIGKRSAAAQPNAVLRSFPASGHLPWLDDPAAHAALVRAFLRGEKV